MGAMNITEAINAGIKVEQEGRAVYEDAAKKTSHRFARAMFESLAGDEQRHEEWFRKLADDMGVAGALTAGLAPDAIVTRIRTLFSEMRSEIDANAPSADDIAVLDVALGLEEKSYEMYSQAAKTAEDPAVREVLEFIAAEENNHYRILDDLRLYLTDPEKWNIKEENPLIDG